MKTVKAVVIPADINDPARIEKIDVTLENLQSLVGGWIEAISAETWTAYINEEGKLHRLQINHAANRILADLGWEGVGRDVVVGPVVIVGPPDDMADDTDIDQRVLNTILAWYRANGTVKKG